MSIDGVDACQIQSRLSGSTVVGHYLVKAYQLRAAENCVVGVLRVVLRVQLSLDFWLELAVPVQNKLRLSRPEVFLGRQVLL